MDRCGCGTNSVWSRKPSGTVWSGTRSSDDHDDDDDDDDELPWMLTFVNVLPCEMTDHNAVPTRLQPAQSMRTFQPMVVAGSALGCEDDSGMVLVVVRLLALCCLVRWIDRLVGWLVGRSCRCRLA